MALKPARYEGVTDISFFMDQVAERGGVVCVKTAGSGAALDQSAAEVEYKASASGQIPIGILLNDMVNKDLTKTKLNPYKNEMQKGSKVTILKQGWVLTNMITGTNPSGVQTAYVGVSGYFSISSASGNVEVGQFKSSVDADGYAKVEINLPR